jgi:DNA-binding SARP family transcriptional activator
LVQVRLLGPVDVTNGDVPRPVAGLRRKAVLAVLGLHAGETVSVERLIDVVWGEQRPVTAANTLQNHVAYLRRLLGVRTAIMARPPGYVLDLPGEATDIAAAERLIQEGNEATDPVRSASLLRSALTLWRGRPLDDIAGAPWLDLQANRLEELQLVAVQALVEVRLALGEHLQLLPELERLTQYHPLHERLHGQRMVALYRAGRQAEALEVFQRLRRRLDDELGIEPSPATRDTQAAILRQDTGLNAPAMPVTVARAHHPSPAQLPIGVSAFAGRDAELGQLDAVLAEYSSPASVAISAISGTAGVGKTALAVHWARMVAARFPDGQLYVNLRGFDPSGSPLDPAQALHGFLDALGVPAGRIPAGLDARSALFRSVLAGRRVLVVLDNARDSEHVRPLLPGAPGCLALITSRCRLNPLAVTESAHVLALGPLAPVEARALLACRLGAAGIAAEPDATDEIIARCARLPLALAIIAARAAARPTMPLSQLAAELHDAAQGPDALDAFDGGDPASDLRTVFSWSYHPLSDGAARMFRLLGAHPGPDVAAPAAASLAGIPIRQAQARLAELTRANLLVEHVAGRYTFDVLVRTYATELAHTVEPQPDRQTRGRAGSPTHTPNTNRPCAVH